MSAAAFMLNPSILQNATYGWTKALAAGFVVMGVCFYLRAIRKGDLWRWCAAARAWRRACWCIIRRFRLFWRLRCIMRWFWFAGREARRGLLGRLWPFCCWRRGLGGRLSILACRGHCLPIPQRRGLKAKRLETILPSSPLTHLPRWFPTR